jgi:hypothetical protein
MSMVPVILTTRTASRNGEDSTTEGALRYTTGAREAGNTVHGNPQYSSSRPGAGSATTRSGSAIATPDPPTAML